MDAKKGGSPADHTKRSDGAGSHLEDIAAGLDDVPDTGPTTTGATIGNSRTGIGGGHVAEGPAGEGRTGPSSRPSGGGKDPALTHDVPPSARDQ